VIQLLAHRVSLWWSIAILAGAVALALLIHYEIFALAKRVTRRKDSVIDSLLVRHGERLTKWILPLLAIVLALPALPLRTNHMRSLQHVAGLGLIALVAWVVILLADVFGDAIYAQSERISDDLTTRRVRTQIHVLRRIFKIIVVLITIPIMLMTFPAIRQVGTSLLASAGIAGLIVGVTMKPTLSSLIAGLQIALTQPIRIDDEVIIEGESGWIEEITTTYVIVRTWDRRRLVVPLSHFIEHSFQNWSRTTSDLLGTVFVYVDYSLAVDEVRQELDRILQSSELWDGKIGALQVTNASEHTMELRALMSASDSSKLWGLRCAVREKLIKFLQERHPEGLPKMRAEIRGNNAATDLRFRGPITATNEGIAPPSESSRAPAAR
jgi:small-conductance mechanosensitive channel